MNTQRQTRATPGNQKIDQKAASRASLQEMFQGSIDPEVVNLILTESDYNVEDAIEKLFTLASTNPLPESEQSSYKKPSTMNQEVSDGPTPISCSDPLVIASGKSYDFEGQQGHIFTRHHSPKFLDKSTEDKTSMSEVSQRLVNSADSMFKSCNGSGKENIKGNMCGKGIIIEASKSTNDNGKFERKGQDVDDTGYSDSFKSFMKNFIASDSDSSEWNSVSRTSLSATNGTKENHGLSHLGTQQKTLKTSQEESVSGEKDRTLNINSNTNRTVNSKDSSKTKGNMDYSDSTRKTTPLNAQSLKKDASISKDLTHINTNALPAWPDSNQFSNFQIAPPQTNIPPSHNINFQNVQPQNIGFNPYGPRYQQFHPRNGHFNVPFNQAFYNAGPRYRPPMQWQPMGFHGQVMYNPRIAQQMSSRPRQPTGFVRTPHNSSAVSRGSAGKTPFKLPDGKVLVLMRGLPGSGKTTFAQRIKGNGIVLSTDDYFMKNGQYQFDWASLGEAHEWNQKRAREAMQGGVSPVIIDNTNTQTWEMKPYVSMAKRLGYQTILKEAETPWRWNPRELFRHNQHGVTLSGIKNMMERYEHNITPDHILNSTINVDNKPKEEQSTEHQCENQVSPNNTQGKKNETVSTEQQPLKFNQRNVDQKKKEPNMAHHEKSKENVVAEERKSQDTQPLQQHPGRKVQQQEQVQKDLLPKKSTTPWKKKTAGTQHQERTMRSHGSRSPVQDVTYIPEEREEQLVDNTVSKAKDEELENILAPKQQRVPRKRERRVFKSKEAVEEVEVQNEVEVEEMKPELELKLSDVQGDENVSVPVESSDSSVSIEVMSEYGSEDSQYEKQVTEFSNEHCLLQDQTKQECLSRNEAVRGHSMENVDKYHSESSSDDLEDVVSGNDEASLLKSRPDNDPGDLVKATLSCNEEEGKAVKETSHSTSNDAIENEEESANSGMVKNAATPSEDLNVPEDKQKIPQESDIESEVDNRDSSSQFSTQTDDAYVSDDEESDDDVIIESEDEEDDDNDNIHMDVVSDTTSDPKSRVTLIKNESQINSSDDSESELSGFEFLNTCFPDIDDKTLQGILSKHHGDVTKAIESILSSSADLIEEKREESGLSYADSSYSSNNNCKHEVPLLPKTPQKVTTPLMHKTTTPINHSSFQMTLEPVVAFHLLELFGPIDGVTFEGEFSPSDLSLTVDREFSKLLYHQWKKSIQKSRGIWVNKDGQQQSPFSSKRKQRTKLKLEEPLPPPSKVSHKATDLREIMNEQMALEQSRREQEKRDSDNNMAVILKRQKLYAMFPGVDPSALEELFEANHFELAPTVSMVQASCNLQPKSTALIEDKPNLESEEEDWSQLLCFAENQEHPENTYQVLEDPEYVDFRAEANMHYKQRDECFKKAAFAFSRKQGQLANFYASQGHLHTEKIKQANDRAAAQILQHKNASSDQFSLDLHGLHVTEALQALEERLNPPDFIHKPKYISVVTGRGLHSKQGRAKIKPAVLDYLQRNNYRHEELHAGLIKVFLK